MQFGLLALSSDSSLEYHVCLNLFRDLLTSVFVNVVVMNNPSEIKVYLITERDDGFVEIVLEGRWNRKRTAKNPFTNLIVKGFFCC